MATNRNEDADKPPLWVSPAFGRTVLLLVLFGLTVSLLFVSEPSGQNALEIGKPSTETVKAPVSISIVDVDETKRLKRRARARVEKVFRHDPKVETKAIDSARQFFASVDTVGPQSDLGAAREQLKTDWNKVDGEAIDKALTLSAADLASTERSAVEIMRALFRDRVTEENLADLRESVDRLLVGIRETDKPVVRETVVAFVRPNYVLDERETAARRNEAAAKIDPVRLTRVEGETVVGEGEVVTPSQGRILDELGLLKDDFGFRRLIGICLITAAVFAVFGAYLWRFQRKVFADPRLIGLVGIMIVAVIGAAKLLNVFPSVYLTPVIAVSMITTILFGGQLGMAAVLIAGFLTSIVVENQLVFLSMAVLGGVFAAYFSNNVSKRETLVRAGLWISLGSAYAVFAASLITDNLLSVALVNSGWGLVGGLFSTVLAIGTLPFLESSFNITTDLKLLELSNPNQPLLRELMTRAPGTYTHSIYAGSIAEAGARAIGANPILARVGAYYHDVGKAKRALFFSENQIGIDNPHDRTQPHLSYLIIAAH
ncbi:MAG: HD family phosphohydrolase, partial [Terriglobia bacterium]